MESKCVHNTSPGNVVQYLFINPINSDGHLKHGADIATASLVDSNGVTFLVFNESDSHDSMAEVGSVNTEDAVNEQNLIQTAASLNIDFSEADLDTTQKQELGTTHLHFHRIEAGGIIKKSNTDWHSPIILVKKKTGNQYRMAIDFRQLNRFNKPIHFPSQSFESIIDALSESDAKYVSCLDLGHGSYQLPLHKEIAHETV